METRRFILYALLAFILYSLWTAWQLEYPNPLANISQSGETSPVSISTGNENTNTNVNQSNPLLPDVDEPNLDEQNTVEKSMTVNGGSTSNGETDKQNLSGRSNATNETNATNATNADKLVHVKTDVLDIDIDLEHGDIVRAQLLDYPVSVDEKDSPIVLLTEQDSHRYTANSSILEKRTNGVQNINFNFHTSAANYEFNDKQDKMNVVLVGQSADGLQAKKTFVFTKGNYLIKVFYDISNESTNPWQGFLNMQIFRTAPDEDKSSIFHIGSFTGASYSNPGIARYKKINFSEMSKTNLNLPVKNGWIAMQQHYFLSAWVPSPQTKNTFYTRAAGDTYTIGFVSQPLVLTPGENKTVGANLYVGPEITSNLEAISPGLDLTLDYGWLWFLSSFLFRIMKAIYNVIGNWGWSIVLVTVLVKLVFYRLSASSYRSMAGMRKLQPKLQALRERCGGDKAKLSQATMELYRQEKINPLGGCLPIVIQIPVFIALYWVLVESVELRQAPFILWINDLAAADPFHVLPIIMGLTMLIQQRLNPAPPDPMQAKIMMFLPVLFTGLFWTFPAGLVLYWVVNNALSILQQWIITRKYS